MTILLVEDDEYKAADIAKVLADSLPDVTVQRAMSVTSALRAVTTESFSLVVLDMSLPTFELSGPGGGGSPQGQGGLEVLRLARRLGNQPPFIIVSQYPDIEIDGKYIRLPAASKALRARFGLDIKACLLYEFDGDSWRFSLRDCLNAMKREVLRGNA